MVRKTPEEIQKEEEEKGKKVKEKLRYYFGVNRIEVCRKTFTETLDITVSHIQSVNKRKSDSGDVALSRQGKRE